MKKLFQCFTAVCGCMGVLGILTAPAQAGTFDLASPDKSLKVSVNIGDTITYSVANRDGVLLENNTAALKLRSGVLGEKPKLKKTTPGAVNSAIKPVVPFKTSTVVNKYNSLVLDFDDDYSIEFRAFDDGFAYRFITRKLDKVDVLDETIRINFPADYLLHYQDPSRRGFASCYEEPYSHNKVSALKTWALLPLLIDTRKGTKIFISETDLLDYPNIFFKKSEGNGLSAFFPPVPVESKIGRDRYVRAVGDAGYIARTAGSRTYPWRYFVVTKTDGDLLETTMGARLAPPCAIADTSWIKPGLSAWDWMNRGKPFDPKLIRRHGVNTDTCKLYVDYAARNGVPYYIIDEGWSRDNGHPKETRAGVNLPEIVNYAKEKGVAIVLWITYLGIQRDFDDDSYNLFEHFSKMGVAGFKIDFMDRSDQDVVNFYERAAAEAAKYKMIVELHGSYKPSGLEFKYPNVLSYEGVRGLEYGRGTTPDNSLFLPFLRNVTGPMSFTPGSLLNVQPDFDRETARFDGYNPMIGTRAHHLAYYVLFDSGLQMISESPALFDKYPDCAKFIHTVPVTWDETRALAAAVGQYAVAARRHGAKWWIGGIANNTERIREFDVTLDFLAPGKNYTLTIFEDGPNADPDANDYTLRKQIVSQGGRLHFKFARNGGVAAIIEPENRD